MTRARGEDRSLLLEQVARRHCPRKLKPGQCKRYLHDGPLFGYTIACPSCGFIEMHQHDEAAFTELGGRLDAAAKPLTCLLCRRTLTIAGGVVAAAAPRP